MARQLNGHHQHHPSIVETHHRHLAPYSYHRSAISWAGSLGGERQHGPPPLAVHENPPLRLYPDGLLTVPTSPIIPSLPVSAFRPVGGYAGNGSIVGLKRLYRTSPRRLPARSSVAANATSG
jgi:hypothetical protein